MSEDRNHPITTGDERLERDLNRHRGDEQRRARAEASMRLRDRGITITEVDEIDEIVNVLEAVEAFERMVAAKGGDLMIDTPPALEPDNAQFVLPRRELDELLGDYAARVRLTTRQLGGTHDD